MYCNSCHRDAYRIRGRLIDGKVVIVCNFCADLPQLWFPDVYFKENYFEEHLADSKNPQGRWISSKREKARIMKEQGVREAGDRVHGGRI